MFFPDVCGSYDCKHLLQWHHIYCIYIVDDLLEMNCSVVHEGTFRAEQSQASD